ncbi:MAG: PD-(D/E)XK motif protein [Bacilli bacterium]
MINKIKNIRENKGYCEDKIYLIEKNNETGFFLMNEKVAFVCFSKNTKSKNIKTNLLLLQTRVKIISVENNNSFESGYYDLILFNDILESKTFDTFVALCRLLAKKIDYDIISYFFMLVEMFSRSNENSKRNSIGLFGELYFIYNSYKKFGVFIQKNWHINHSSDISDFQFSRFQVEVKTTTRINRKFKLKYDQLILPRNLFLTALNVYKDTPEGMTIEKLIDDILKINEFANDIDFLMKIEIEISKIDLADKKTRYYVWNEAFFHIDDLNIFKDVPNNITDIQFDYLFSNERESDFISIFNNDVRDEL